jgi:superfamily II DNA or RNA helicase
MSSSKFLAHKSGNFIHISEFNQLRADYTLKNLKKVKAIRMGQVWCNKKFLPSGKPNKSYMPDFLTCYTQEEWSSWVKVPAGIRSTLSFESHYDPTIITHPNLLRNSYEYQTTAVGQLLQQSTGLLHASTWSGKTQMICDIMSRLSRNSIIMVQNLTQMGQMVDDIQWLLGIIPTQISGKKYSQKEQSTWYPHITVCSIDSRDKVDDRSFGLILLDEADTYLGSDARREWVGSLSNEYIYWLTGTVKVNDMDSKVFDIYYGKKTVLHLLNHTPHYTQVLSDFRFHIDDPSQFHELKAALYTSEKRNALIVRTVCNNLGTRKWVVFCEYVEHAKELQRLLEVAWVKTYLLIWEVPKEERERIRTDARNYEWGCVIIWSVKIIGRGFDLPELSLAVLTTCERFDSNIMQYVGRLARHHPEKPQAMFYDLCDNLQSMLNSQSISRLRTYRASFKEWKTFIQT